MWALGFTRVVIQANSHHKGAVSSHEIMSKNIIGIIVVKHTAKKYSNGMRAILGERDRPVMTIVASIM
jgi:hypothetical protein